MEKWFVQCAQVKISVSKRTQLLLWFGLFVHVWVYVYLTRKISATEYQLKTPHEHH